MLMRERPKERDWKFKKKKKINGDCIKEIQ